MNSWRRTLELSGNAEAEARACRLLIWSSIYHSNGLELFLPQWNLTGCKRHARAEAQAFSAAVICSAAFTIAYVGETTILWCDQDTMHKIPSLPNHPIQRSDNRCSKQQFLAKEEMTQATELQEKQMPKILLCFPIPYELR
jgi:hypothetical protein